MAASPRIRQRNQQYQGNVTKRGSQELSQKKKEDKVQNNLNPYVVGFIIFVVVGSAIFQIIQSLQVKPE